MQNIQSGWFFVDLGQYRPMPDFGTYYCFSYEELPPLPESIVFDGSFSWLSTAEPEPAESETTFIKLLDQAKAANITLPRSFLRFMNDEGLRAELEGVSCTACYIELTNGLIEIPGSPGEYIIHFLSDQQYCLLWYLYIKDGKEAGVLVSPDFFAANGHETNGGWPANEKRFLYAATDFERFLYRFWIENVLWDKVAYSDSGTGLNAIERAYLDHYKK